MSLWTDLTERLRSLVFRARDEQELAEEVEFHVAMEAAGLERQGLSPEQARRQARIDFGGPAQVQEAVRDARGTRLLDQLRQDLRFAVRSLRHHRGFALVTVLVLGCGIGANTATFTLVNALMLRALPVEHPGELVTIGNTTRTGSLSEGRPSTELYSYPIYEEVRLAARTVSGIYATGRTPQLDLRTEGATGALAGGLEHPRGRFVSGNFFAVLGVPALLGRTFNEEDTRAPGSGSVVVVSHAYWRRVFGGQPGAIGRQVVIGGVPLTLIGVTPPGFTGDLVGQPRDLWIPLTAQPLLMANRDWLGDRNSNWLLLMGRRAPGVTLAQARAELTALVSRALLEHAEADEVAPIQRDLDTGGIPVGPGERGFSYVRKSLGTTLGLLTAAVGLVLLLVAANLANLMLARGAARGREMSIRLSLGAARRRVVAQLFTEAIVLAAMGGGLGLLLARLGSRVLLALAGSGQPLPLEVPLDARVLVFTGGISLVAVMLFGVAPALRTTRVELAGALRASGQSLVGGGNLRAHRLLVVTQVALSTVLLVGTAMIARTLGRLNDADLGLDRDRLLIADLDAVPAGYQGERLAVLRRDLLERIGLVPGVERATTSENGLFNGTESRTSITVPGFVPADPADLETAYDDVGPGYFETVGARILRGRDFSDEDNAVGARVAVINATMARFYFPTTDPIGRLVMMDDVAFQVVGIVADVKGHQVRESDGRRLYLPMDQLDDAPGRFRVVIRSAGDPGALVDPVRRAVRSADPDLVIAGVDPFSELVRESLGQDRMAARVIGGFGALALLLAALGLYGVMAYATVRRSSEFGLRMALGAERATITWMVVREALLLVAAGAAIGVPAALTLARVFRNLWFGIAAVDPLAIASALGAMFLAALLAAGLPAWRASRVPPLLALRAD